MTNLMPPSFRAAVAGFLSCPLLIFMNIPLIAASGPGLPPKRHSIMPQQSAPPRRDREVLVQFRDGVGPQEREMVLGNLSRIGRTSTAAPELRPASECLTGRLGFKVPVPQEDQKYYREQTPEFLRAKE